MKKLEKVLENISAAILLFMLVCVLLQVLFRFVLKISAPWTEEFARMGYIWMVFMMLPVLEARDAQLKVVYFFQKIPLTVRLVLYWLMTALYVVVLAFLIVGSINYYQQTQNLTFGSVKWLLVCYQYVPIIFGSVSGILYIIRRAFHFKEVFEAEKAEYEV